MIGSIMQLELQVQVQQFRELCPHVAVDRNCSSFSFKCHLHIFAKIILAAVLPLFSFIR